MSSRCDITNSSIRPFLFIFVCAALAHAQDSSTDAPPIPTKESLAAKTQAIENNTTLTPAQRDTAISLCTQMQVELDAIEASEQQRSAFKARYDEIPTATSQLTEATEALDAEPSIDATGLALEELDKRVREVQLELEVAKSSFDQWRDELQRRADRSMEIPRLLAALVQQVEELKQQDTEPVEGVPAELAEATKLSIQTRLRRAQADSDRLKQELAFYDAAVDLLPLRIQFHRKQVESLTAVLTQWQNAAAASREQISKQQRAQTKSTIEGLPPALQELARRRGINELPQDLISISNEIKTFQDRRRESDELMTRLNEQFNAISGQINELTRVSGDVGMILRQRQSELRAPRLLRRENSRRQALASTFRLKRLKNDQVLLSLMKLPEVTESELLELKRKEPDTPVAELEPMVVDLLEKERDLRQKLQREYRLYFSTLFELNVQQESMISQVERYRQFIDEKLIWVPSTDPVGQGDFRDAVTAVQYAVFDADWSDVLLSVFQRLRRHFWPQAMVLLAAIVMLVYRGKLHRGLIEYGAAARRKTCTDSSLTVKALAATLVLAATWPTLLFWLSLNLRVGEAMGSTLSYSLSKALQMAAFVYVGLSVWSYVVRKHGLADAHFDWGDHALRLTRRHLIWLTPIAVGSWGVCEFFDRYDLFESAYQLQQTTCRIALVVGLVALAVFSLRMFSPRSGVLQPYLARRPSGWAWRLRHIWYPLLVGVPVVLALLALVGYVYTSSYLVNHLGFSFFFLGGVVLLESLGLRWARLNRRQLAISQARERLAAAREEQATIDEEGGSLIGHEQIDLQAVNEQTVRLFNSFSWVVAVLGLYFIWVDVLPAMTKLEDVRLWPTTVEVERTTEPTEDAGDGAAAQVETIRELRWITLSNLCAAILVLFLTFVAIRNIPGLLEIAILQHLPLETALRYAITTVTRYAIIVGGIVVAFGSIGIGWSYVQWSVAAVSVGLGFGLQEIFANFVSGLILLFERPLRAGDVVTIGDVTGQVVKINIRATTIQDWDRKELVVPNKEFITGRLLNWTLTDTTNRLVISVGVAYGCDVGEACRVVLEAAQRHPAILDDPAPSVAFDLFGDSALNLTLRAFLPSLDSRISVTHELHEDIYNGLAKAGIEIPFPQRDLHLRSSEAIRLATTQESEQNELPGNGRPEPTSETQEEV